MTHDGQNDRLTHAGFLFFAKLPELSRSYWDITCALYKGTSNVHILDRKDLNDDLMSNIENAIIYAVLHRDYTETGARVMVEIFDDRVEISDPGGLPPSLKTEDFGKRSVLRNAKLADLLQRAGYIERMGTGIRRIREICSENGTPAPEYEFTGFFSATYARTTDVISVMTGELARKDIRERLGLKNDEHFRKAFLVPAIEAGLIEMTMPDKPKSTKQRYRLTDKGRKKQAGDK